MEDLQKIRAKTVVNDNFWILQKNNVKVGYAKKTDKNIEIKIDGATIREFISVKDMKDSNMFDFTELPKPPATVSEDVHGYPTNESAYNAVWNLKYKLPLYTQSPESKSWYAAGYYRVNIGGLSVVQYCPKLIALQRTTFEGPFKTDPGLNQFNTIFE
jgi:hypothetical protein